MRYRTLAEAHYVYKHETFHTVESSCKNVQSFAYSIREHFGRVPLRICL